MSIMKRETVLSYLRGPQSEQVLVLELEMEYTLKGASFGTIVPASSNRMASPEMTFMKLTTFLTSTGTAAVVEC